MPPFCQHAVPLFLPSLPLSTHIHAHTPLPQVLVLMDRLFKTIKLDLCMTPYEVLATTKTSGMMFFVSGSDTMKV